MQLFLNAEILGEKEELRLLHVRTDSTLLRFNVYCIILLFSLACAIQLKPYDRIDYKCLSHLKVKPIGIHDCVNANGSSVKDKDIQE